jgi:hypothetical protein
MPVLAATATGKIVEGIVPPIKVGLLVQHLVAEPYIVGLSRHQVMDASEPPFLDPSWDGPVFTQFSALPSALSSLRVSPA